MSRPRRALLSVAALAGLLLSATAAQAALRPAPEAPWATANGRVLAIVRVNNVVYIGGKFTQMVDRNGTVLTRSHLAAVSAADGHVLPWNPGANNTVRSLAVSTDGKTIYIGGDFTSLGGRRRGHTLRPRPRSHRRASSPRAPCGRGRRRLTAPSTRSRSWARGCIWAAPSCTSAATAGRGSRRSRRRAAPSPRGTRRPTAPCGRSCPSRTGRSCSWAGSSTT